MSDITYSSIEIGDKDKSGTGNSTKDRIQHANGKRQYHQNGTDHPFRLGLGFEKGSDNPRSTHVQARQNHETGKGGFGNELHQGKVGCIEE